MYNTGIDVSEHNGGLDWEEIRRAGIAFAIIRLGWGRGHLDRLFYEHINGALAAELPVGVYYYSYADTPKAAEDEAWFTVHVLADCGLSPGKLPLGVWYDMEDADGWKAARGLVEPSRITAMCGGMFLLCPDLGFGEREKIAVTVIERHARKAGLSPRDLIADDRFLTSAIDRNACFHELHHTQCILRGLWHDAVPVHRSHADEVDSVRFHRQHHGNGIIRAGIAVKNYFLRNHSRIPP